MKKIISAVLSCLICIMCITPALAAEKACLYGNNCSVNAGETVSIPVSIKNNPGMMGFRITVKYDSKVFSSPSVEVGSVVSKGNFNDSISDKTNGSFDVVWNNTEDAKDDGTLFIVKLKASQSAKAGNYNVEISYNQADTFNEKWEDVKLSCNSASVNIISDEIPGEPSESSSLLDTIISLLITVWNWFVGLFK